MRISYEDGDSTAFTVSREESPWPISFTFEDGTVTYLSNAEARALGLALLGVTTGGARAGRIYGDDQILTTNRLSTDGKTVRVEKVDTLIQRVFSQPISDDLARPNPLFDRIRPGDFTA